MLFKKRNKHNDIKLSHAKRKFKEQTLVLGNGISNFVWIECSQCNHKFTEFDFVYVEYAKGYHLCCPNCKADITQHTFYPLDAFRKRIN